MLTIVAFDYDQGAQQIILTPGGPDEISIQLRIRADAVFERNKTLLLIFLPLTVAAIEFGVHIGIRNESRLTIINDDSKIKYFIVNA